LEEVLTILSSGERLNRRDRLQFLLAERGKYIVGRMLERALGPGYGLRLAVKGGVITAGKVALSPWIWIYLRRRPFYSLAYLFATDGHAAFLSLGVDNEGTAWEDNAARLHEHAEAIRKAVKAPAGAQTVIDDLAGPHESRRARAHAAGNAYAFRYRREGLPEADQLWEDLYRMVELLRELDATGLRLE
jgi:hypothetical protein